MLCGVPCRSAEAFEFIPALNARLAGLFTEFGLRSLTLLVPTDAALAPYLPALEAYANASQYWELLPRIGLNVLYPALSFEALQAAAPGSAFHTVSVFDIVKASGAGAGNVTLVGFKGATAGVLPTIYSGLHITVLGIDQLLVPDQLGIGATPGVGVPDPPQPASVQAEVDKASALLEFLPEGYSSFLTLGWNLEAFDGILALNGRLAANFQEFAIPKITILAPTDAALAQFYPTLISFAASGQYWELLPRLHHSILYPSPAYQTLLGANGGTPFPTASVFDLVKTSPSGSAPVTFAAYNGSASAIIRPNIFVGSFITVHGIDTLLVPDALGLGPLPAVGVPDPVRPPTVDSEVARARALLELAPQRYDSFLALSTVLGEILGSRGTLNHKP